MPNAVKKTISLPPDLAIVGDYSAVRVRRPLGRCSHPIRIDMNACNSFLSASPIGLSMA